MSNDVLSLRRCAGVTIVKAPCVAKVPSLLTRHSGSSHTHQSVVLSNAQYFLCPLVGHSISLPVTALIPGEQKLLFDYYSFRWILKQDFLVLMSSKM